MNPDNLEEMFANAIQNSAEARRLIESLRIELSSHFHDENSGLGLVLRATFSQIINPRSILQEEIGLPFMERQLGATMVSGFVSTFFRKA